VGTATHNFAGTYKTKMPMNGVCQTRYTSVFGHLLPYVEQDNVYKLITNPNNAAVAPAVTVIDATNTNTTVNYRTAVIPSYQAPSDSTQAASNGSDPNGIGTTSIASNGCLFNGSNGFVNAAVPTPGTVIGGPAANSTANVTPPAQPRLPASFIPGTSNVVMFATRYATCGSAPTQSYWSSPATTWFNAAAIQVGPSVGTTAVAPQVLCLPNEVQSYNAAGAQVCMGDNSVRTVAPSVATATWQIAINPQTAAVLPSNWIE
jgi:hypothetical protein